MVYFQMEFDAPSRTFVRREFGEPGIGSGEILIRVTCCTICGSDLHTYCGRRHAPQNCVLGHEIIGEVVTWAGQHPPADFHGNPLRRGQRVTWSMAVGCGRCFYCRNNLGQKCESLFKYGHEPGGCSGSSGGLSNVCVLVPGTPVFPVPDAICDEVACPANCATATVVAAVRLIGETHSMRDANVVIYGAGMLGLTATALVSDAKARQVIVVDPDPARLNMAPSFGATLCLNAAHEDDLPAAIAARTEGRGADIAIEISGATPAVTSCLTTVRTGGCILLVGSVFPSDSVLIAPEDIVRRMITLRGLHNYLPGDLDKAIGFLERAQGRFPFHQLVTESFWLADTQRAFDHAIKYRSVRVSVKPALAETRSDS